MISRVELNSDEVPPETTRGDKCRARTAERIEDKIALDEKLSMRGISAETAFCVGWMRLPVYAHFQHIRNRVLGTGRRTLGQKIRLLMLIAQEARSRRSSAFGRPNVRPVGSPPRATRRGTYPLWTSRRRNAEAIETQHAIGFARKPA